MGVPRGAAISAPLWLSLPPIQRLTCLYCGTGQMKVCPSSSAVMPGARWVPRAVISGTAGVNISICTTSAAGDLLSQLLGAVNTLLDGFHHAKAKVAAFHRLLVIGDRLLIHAGVHSFDLQ